MPESTYSEEKLYQKMCEMETRLIAIEKKLQAVLLARAKKDDLDFQFPTGKGFGGTCD